MSQEILSVEQVAERLGLHVRTIRSYVRDGRLPAIRIGKQYRIARADLDAFVGVPEPARGRPPEVSAVVDIEDLSPDVAVRVSNALIGALNGRRPGDPPIRAETIYDPERRRLKVIVLGGLAATADLLRMIEIWAGEVR